MSGWICARRSVCSRICWIILLIHAELGAVPFPLIAGLAMIGKKDSDLSSFALPRTPNPMRSASVMRATPIKAAKNQQQGRQHEGFALGSLSGSIFLVNGMPA